MKLNEIWAIEPRITTDMARRESNHDKNCYVSLWHLTPDDAVKEPFKDWFLTGEDILADDWYIWNQHENI
jgi:hypothetical protein